MAIENANPTVHVVRDSSQVKSWLDLFEDDETWLQGTNDTDKDTEEPLDAEEIFGRVSCIHLDRTRCWYITDLIRSISDPEHPLTLEQLAVVSASQVTVKHGKQSNVLVEFTPTIPHCSMATLIGNYLALSVL